MGMDVVVGFDFGYVLMLVVCVVLLFVVFE